MPSGSSATSGQGRAPEPTPGPARAAPTRPVALGVLQRLDQSLGRLLADAVAGVGEQLVPVRRTADARGLEAGVVQRLEHLVLAHVAHRLDALEAGRLDGP